MEHQNGFCRMHCLMMGFLLLSILGTQVHGVGNESITALPSEPPDTSWRTQLRTFLTQEDAARFTEMAFAGFVVSGGTHSTSASMTSPAFATTAYTANGNRVVQSATAINYSLLGCAATDTAWVIISAAAGVTLSNFTRVPATDYFVNCLDTSQPALPTDSVWLMRVTIAGSAITAVSPMTNSRPTAPSILGIDVASVREYGALGDGVTDDGPALTRALASNRVLLFPTGTYRMTSALNINGLTNVTLLGLGHATIEQVTTHTSGITITGASTGIHIERLILMGANATAAVGGGLGIAVGIDGASGTDDREDVWIIGTRISGFSHACIGVFGSNSSGASSDNRDVFITQNHVEDCRTGIFVYKGAHRVMITQNRIHATWSDGIAIDTQSAGDPAVTYPNDSLTVAGNVITDTGALESLGKNIGLLVKGQSAEVTVSGNVIRRVGQAQPAGNDSFGILLQGDASNANPIRVTLTGNTVENVVSTSQSAFGLYIGESRQVTVTGNAVDVATDGIRVHDSQNVTVVGNLVNAPASFGMNITGPNAGGQSTRVVVANNTLTRGTGSALNGININFAANVQVGENQIDQAFTNPIAISTTNATYVTTNVAMLDRLFLLATVGNTVTQTTVFTAPVPANWLDNARGLRLTLWGDYTNNSGGNADLTIRVKYGSSTAMAGMNTLFSAASARGVELRAVLLAPTPTAQRWHGDLVINTTNTATMATPAARLTNTFTTTENAATALDLVVTIEHSVANAAITFNLRAAILERF